MADDERAREGARIAVLPDYTDTQVTTTAELSDRWTPPTPVAPRLSSLETCPLALPPRRVSVNYPFQFMVIGPVARLVRAIRRWALPHDAVVRTDAE